MAPMGILFFQLGNYRYFPNLKGRHSSWLDLRFPFLESLSTFKGFGAILFRVTVLEHVGGNFTETTGDSTIHSTSSKRSPNFLPESPIWRKLSLSRPCQSLVWRKQPMAVG